jgi:hypothetical protein
MRRRLRENGLALVMFGIFAVVLVGQSLTGWAVYNAEEQDHGQPPVDYAHYLTTGHFVEAVFENWESEFLQMGAYVVFTAFLFQKGSPESKRLDESEDVDEDPRAHRNDKDAPWPVRRGGLALILYEHSLSLALFTLFAIAFVLHVAGGASAYNHEQALHGGDPLSLLGFVASPQLWFQSFQNWQSEFLSVGVLVVLSVYLRERGSPESKPVHHPHRETGEG